MGRIFITSDLHFNHDKDFIWKARGFNSVQEMNEELIKRYNSVVQDEDTVYILGDSMMGMNVNEGLAYLRRLKGTKYLALGNHDTNTRIEAYKNSGIFAEVAFAYRLKVKGKQFYLTHYPTITSNGDEGIKVFNLYGHTHQTSNFYENNKFMYHVGVDSHDCYPVAIEDIIEELEKENK